jgi:anti-anti-sigma factor
MTGALDEYPEAALQTVVEDLLNAEFHDVLPGSSVQCAEDAGLRLLKRLRSDVRANGGTLTLRNVQEDVMEIFEMTGFAAMLTFE